MEENIETVETGSLESEENTEDSFLSGLDENELGDGEEVEENEGELEESEGESGKSKENQKAEALEDGKSPEEQKTTEAPEATEAPEVTSLRTELAGEKTRSTVYEELLRDTGHNYTLKPQLERFCTATGQSPQDFLAKLNDYCDNMGAPPINNFTPDTRSIVMKKATCDWREFMQNHPDIKDPEKELGDAAWNEIKKGLSPESAYLKSENQRLKLEIERLQSEGKAKAKNIENKRKSPGAIDNRGETKNEDLFLKGLFG